jgi:hypothetical protein
MQTSQILKCAVKGTKAKTVRTFSVVLFAAELRSTFDPGKK